MVRRRTKEESITRAGRSRMREIRNEGEREKERAGKL